MRLLVVAYYFPPAGGAGVQRVLKWVKYLRDFGIEPVVLTVEAGSYPSLDTSLVRDVPPDIEVHRTRSLDPFGVYAKLQGRSRQQTVAAVTGRISQDESWGARAARWVRANVFVPDARVGWVPFAVRAGRRLLRERGDFGAILTSGPPHSVHLTGAALHRRTGLPWIADFRDPWMDIHYNYQLPRSRTARAVDAAMERMVLSRASAVTTVSPSLRRLLGEKTVRGAETVHVIYNGYDAEDFGPPEPVAPRDRFTLSYIGTLYNQPRALWTSLARLRAEGKGHRFRVRLVGSVPPDTEAVVADYGLADCAEVVSYVSHDEAVREMQQATALLLTIEDWPHNEIVMPGKMYEYLAAGRPVIGLGPPEGDAANVLTRTGAGTMFGQDDGEKLYRHLADLYRRWEAGETLSGASREAARPFARRAQTETLARLVQTLTRS